MATNKQSKKKKNPIVLDHVSRVGVFAHDLLLKCCHDCQKENTFRRVMGGESDG